MIFRKHNIVNCRFYYINFRLQMHSVTGNWGSFQPDGACGVNIVSLIPADTVIRNSAGICNNSEKPIRLLWPVVTGKC